MKDEQLIVFLIFGAFWVLQTVSAFLKRMREQAQAQAQAQANGRGAAPEPESLPEEDTDDEPWWEPPPEPPRPSVRRAPAPPAVEPPKPPARAAITPYSLERSRHDPALKVRIARGDRTQLRRAFALMAILGPPRSQEPPG